VCYPADNPKNQERAMARPGRFLPASLLVVLLSVPLCSCSSQLHLVQTKSGRGYISRLEPERIERTGRTGYRFEDSERVMILLAEEDILEIRPIDASEARRLNGPIYFTNGFPEAMVRQ
jgi:hypothetical protein